MNKQNKTKNKKNEQTKQNKKNGNLKLDVVKPLMVMVTGATKRKEQISY